MGGWGIIRDMNSAEVTKYWYHLFDKSPKEASRVLLSPACSFAEVGFYLFLLASKTYQNPLIVIDLLVKPFSQSCETEKIVSKAVQKCVNLIQVGEPTYVCLTGPLAGTICDEQGNAVRPLVNSQATFIQALHSPYFKHITSAQQNELFIRRMKREIAHTSPLTNIIYLLQELYPETYASTILANNQLFQSCYPQVDF